MKNPFAEYDAKQERERLMRLADEHNRRIDNLFLPFDPEAPIFKGRHSWLIEDLLPAGGLVLLAADAKEGKTDFANALAMAVALGKPFLGKPTTQANVLWIAAEESSTERYRAMNLYDIEPDPTREIHVPAYSWDPSDRAIPFYTTFEPLALDTEEGIGDLQDCINRHYAGLVIVDPLYGVTTRDLASGAGARRSLALLKKMTGIFNATVIVLHQSSRAQRGERPADSVQLAATAGMYWTLNVQPTDSGRAIQLRSRGRGNFANRLWHLSSPAAGKYALADPAEVPLAPIAPTLSNRIVAAVADAPKTAADIATILGESRHSVEVTVSRLAKSQRLVRRERTRNGYLFSTPEKTHNPVENVENVENAPPVEPEAPKLDAPTWPDDLNIADYVMAVGDSFETLTVVPNPEPAPPSTAAG